MNKTPELSESDGCCDTAERVGGETRTGITPPPPKILIPSAAVPVASGAHPQEVMGPSNQAARVDDVLTPHAASGPTAPRGAAASARPRAWLSRTEWLNLALLLCYIIVAGVTPVAAKDALTEMPALTTGVIRFAVAGLLFVVTVRLLSRGDTAARLPVRPRDWALIISAGVLAVPLNQACFLVGVKWANSSHAGLMYGLTPVLVYLMTLAAGMTQASWRMGIAALLAFLGAAALSWEGLQVHRDTQFLLGDLLLFGAVLTWAVYSILIVPLVRRFGPLRAASYVLGVGALLYLPALLIDGRDLNIAALSPRALGGFIFIAVFSSYLNYFLWFLAMQRMSVNRLTISTNASPIVAVLAAHFWRDEPLTIWLAIGGAMILSAIALANSRRQGVAPER